MSTGSMISLADTPLFKGISPATLAPLQATCRPVEVERLAFLFKQGERGKDLYIITQGQLRIWKEGEDGESIDLAVLGPYEVVGELELIDGKRRDAHAQALEPTKLVALQRDAFFNHLGQYSGMAVQVMTVLSERLRQNNLRQMQLHRKHQPEARAARALLMLPEARFTQEGWQADIAYVLGMEAVALQRILEGWSRDGVATIKDDGSLEIHKPAALEDIANAG